MVIPDQTMEAKLETRGVIGLSPVTASDTPKVSRRTKPVKFDWRQCPTASPPPFEAPQKITAVQPIQDASGLRGFPGGWDPIDECGLSKCKHCQKPIVWGELEEYEPRLTSDRSSMEWVKKVGPTRFRPLDPDLFPHACWKAAAVHVSENEEAG